MHARHRNPGNGYRSNSINSGRVGPGRISPERVNPSCYNHRNSYNNNNNSNRGYGRSRSFHHHPPPPLPAPSMMMTSAQPRKGGDVFMDAGRMAAEYLVAQGVLPPSVLSAKWHKKPAAVAEFEGDQMREDNRTSALSRLGNFSEGGYRRGKFPEEFSSSSSNVRNSSSSSNNKGRRRRDRGDWGRSGSFPDRHSRAASSEDDSNSVRHDEQKTVGREVGSFVRQQNVRESKDAADSEIMTASEKKDKEEDMSSKLSSSGANGDGVVAAEVSVEPEKLSDVEMKYEEIGEINETEKKTAVEELPVEGKAEDEGTDLLKLCKFANVPTRIRSALTAGSSKVDLLPSIQERSTSSSIAPQVLVENNTVDVSSSGTSVLDNSHYASCVDNETSKVESSQSVENLVESSSGFGIEHNMFERSRSLPDRAFMHEIEQKEIAGLRSFSFAVSDRGEKRALEDYDKQTEAKRPREWHPYADSDDCFQISNLSEKKASPLEDNTSAEKVIVAVDHDSSMGNDPQFQKHGAEICIDYMQEKQLFPNSFDLNLMEASNAHENRVINYPGVSGVKKEAAPVDIDLAMSNCNMSREKNRHSMDGKEIEVIDLDNDSLPEDDAFHDAERNTTGSEFIPVAVFSNQPQKSSGINDGQDGYGLMISELLGNDFPTCSSVPDNLTSMPNDIGLPNAEGTLAEDDSIYMALGEIPLTFMRSWEQPPPQEYEKPF